MTNLLTDPIIGIETKDGRKKVNLPMLLAMLSDGKVDAYTGQRPHQADVWHVFTVQLAASILARHPNAQPDALPADPLFWQEGLLELAGGNSNAWLLVGEDVTQPAFFQHPLTSKSELTTSFKPKEPKAATPDELDVLVTAKDHDLKLARFPNDELEAWMYALVSYQTTSGFLGAGNYGIVRMNGGFANRPILSLVQSLHPAQRFREETAIVLNIRNELLRSNFGFKPNGKVLTWLTSWNRAEHQYRLDELDPLFIETPRAIRLVKSGKGLVALGATSKARQIGPKSLENGDVGDAWIPIQTANKKGRAALSVSGTGWTPELVCNLLFEKGYELTSLQKPRKAPSALWFVASTLVRGQGTTEGFHRFLLPVPPKVQLRLLNKVQKDRLSELAQQLLNDVRDVESALRMAMTVLTEGGPDNPDFNRDAVKAWVNGKLQGFRTSWQDRFFPTLWHSIEIGEEEARKEWIADLIHHSKQRLQEAAQLLPLPQTRRYRAKVRSDGAFWGLLHKRGLIMKEVA
ncbi:type I-E CRISPR-associated protein Cse1/CasA [Desulfatirhabdium butyrativorans]|uniref:type I-E CRISPR-associated protein Cse1/CasA n=1 Tax=Desulfatirhabdium butyrativorans TaxID=340467 RepID=UPI000411CDD8|nr:type I-E CRISPR-associated protein Cse1/CasA [Desulfatirhabdium butyrativorans]